MAKTFSDWTKRKSRTLPEPLPSHVSKSTLLKLYEYENILLRDYIAISTTGNYELLVIEGMATKEGLIEQWEKIVRQNSIQNGDRGYDSYFQLLKSYGELVASYIISKTSLLKLAIAPLALDYELVDDLKKRGFKIDVANYSEDFDKYLASIESNLRKVDNLVTKARMKEKEITKQFETADKGGKVYGFEEIMANLHTSLGFVVPDNVTLARYNEYKKIVAAKIKAQNARN